MKHSTQFDPSGDAGHVLHAIGESSHDAIIVTDIDGVVLAWNDVAEGLCGRTAADMRDRPLPTLAAGPQTEVIRSVLGRACAGEGVTDEASVWRTNDGRLIEVLLNVSALRHADGRIVGTLFLARDVTAQKRAEAARIAAEARWRAIIESAVDAIVMIDARGTIEVFNPAAARMFGYAEEEAVGRNISLLMQAPDGERHDGYLHRYLLTGEQKVIGVGRQVTALRRDGTTLPVHLSVGEVRIGEERHFTGILHDLTERMRLEAQVREQASLVRLGEMAAVIAHEVKNPLAAVRGATQVVAGRLPADSKDGHVAGEIVARIDALAALIDDLLLFARLPQPHFAPVDLGALLREAAGLLADDQVLRGTRIEIAGAEPPVMGDAQLLRIVFQNLLVNGAQAMQGRGVIAVALARRGETQQVTVTDTGPGFSPEAYDNLFLPFFTTKARGTGLGLSTAKRLVEAHRGTIRVESKPGVGATLVVALPASPAE